MLNSQREENQKLIPLRRLAEECGIYDKSYLSQLVQRKKLKAKRIGRNYYTTREWFNEYLEFFARDQKRKDILINSKPKPSTNVSDYNGIPASISLLETGSDQPTAIKQLAVNILPDIRPKPADQKLGSAGFFVWFRSLAGQLKSVTIMNFSFWLILFFLAALPVLIYSKYENYKYSRQSAEVERVAGIEEKALPPGSGELKDGFLIYEDSLYKVHDSISTKDGEVKTLEKVEPDVGNNKK